MKSLRTLLTVRLLCGGALLLGAAGVALHWQIRRALTTEFDASVRATVQYLAIHSEQKVGGLKVERQSATLPQFDEPDGAEIFLLRTADGTELQRSRSLGDTALPLRAGSPEDPVFFETPRPGGGILRCAGVRYLPKMGKKARGEGLEDTEVILVAGRDRAPLDRTLAALRAALLLVGAAALATLAMIVSVGVRGGLAPLARLSEAVASVDAASLATRFPTEPLPAELRPMASRLNELLARLEASFEREQRFTATVAHELRTPLAELRAVAEVNLTTPSTDQERAESWRDALAATRRMEMLAVRLLELARANDPQRVVRHEPVALASAVAEAWRPWSKRGAARGITLSLALPEGLCARSDAALLGIVLGNLCGNAAEHAAAHAPLNVSATSANGSVIVRLRNRTESLTAADLPHFFEPFWRKDTARAGGEHYGLGLALAAEFAGLLGGELTAQLCSENDLELALRLPRA